MLPHSEVRFPHCLGLSGREIEAERGGSDLLRGFGPKALERQTLESDRLGFESSLEYSPAV